MHFCVAKTLLPNRFSLSKYASVLQLAIAGERRLSGVPKPEEHGHSVVSQERDLGLVTLGSRDSVHRFMRRAFSYPVPTHPPSPGSTGSPEQPCGDVPRGRRADVAPRRPERRHGHVAATDGGSVGAEKDLRSQPLSLH